MTWFLLAILKAFVLAEVESEFGSRQLDPKLFVNKSCRFKNVSNGAKNVGIS